MFNRVLKVPTKGLWDALRDLVPFVQFKKTWKHPWRSVSTVAGYNLKNMKNTMEEYYLVKLLAAIWENMKTSMEECYFCKVAGYGCFSRFLNCTNGTKSHNASQLYPII